MRRREDRLATEEPLEIRLAWPGAPAAPRRRHDAHPRPRLRARHRLPVRRGRPRLRRRPADGRLLHRRDLDPRAGVQRRHRRAGGRRVARRPALRRARRRRRSACGVCGTESIDDVLALCDVRASARWAGLRVSADGAAGLPDRLREAQRVFDSHRRACTPPGLFDADGHPGRRTRGRRAAQRRRQGGRRPHARPATSAGAAGALRQRPDRLRARAEGGRRRDRRAGRRRRPVQPRGRAGRARPAWRSSGFTRADRFVVYAATGATASACDRRILSAPPPSVRPCASCTPPTGTWAGRSTGSGCSTRQAAYVDHLLDVVEAEQVDLVVVSGDVYDRALPPVDAVELADEAFARLAASRAAGRGHQRQPRLRRPARLQRPAGRRGRRAPAHPLAGRRHARSLLEDAHGPVAVYGIPYLEPDAVRSAWDLPARAATRRRSTAAMSRVARRPRHAAAGARSVVLAHAFVAGARAAPRWLRQRARHLRRRRLQIAPTSLFDRRRLRRPRPPARAADPHRHRPLQRLTARLLVLRGRPHQGLLARRPRRRRAQRGRRSCRRRCRAGWPRCAAASTTCSPTRRTPTPRTPGSRSPSPTAAGRCTRWTGCAQRFPHTLMLGFDPEGAAGAATDRSCPGSTAAATSTWRSASSPRCATSRPPTEEELLLQLACDACRIDDDRDADCQSVATSAGRLMRLHHLTVTAFGPFAGHRSVDFEELNDAGLFLLTGPTGAGKTQHPRRGLLRPLRRRCPARAGAKTLKSQHAGPTPAPRSSSTFSVRGRRFRSTPHARSGPAQAARRRAHPREGRGVARRDPPDGEDHFLSSRATRSGC